MTDEDYLRARMGEIDLQVQSVMDAVATLRADMFGQMTSLQADFEASLDAIEDTFSEPQVAPAVPEPDTRKSFYAKITGVNTGDDEFPYDWVEARWNVAGDALEEFSSSLTHYNSAEDGKARDANDEGGYEVDDFVLVTRVVTDRNDPPQWQHVISRAAPGRTSFIAKFIDYNGLIWRKQTFSKTAGTFTDAVPEVTGSLATNTKDANGNIKMEQGLMVMMHEINTSGSWKYVFFHPVPYLEECESITARTDGNPIAALTTFPAKISEEGTLKFTGCGLTNQLANYSSSGNSGYPLDTGGIVGVTGTGTESDPYVYTFHAAILYMEKCESITARTTGYPVSLLTLFPAKIASSGGLNFTADCLSTGEADADASGNSSYPIDTGGIVGVTGGGTLSDPYVYTFHAAIPYMDQYEVITALSSGAVDVTNVRVSST